MKPKDIITIYANPSAKTNRIGEAELVRKVRDYSIFEWWEVKFIGEEFTRLVLVKPELCEKQ